jgi:hypothetical protein
MNECIELNTNYCTTRVSRAYKYTWELGQSVPQNESQTQTATDTIISPEYNIRFFSKCKFFAHYL